MRPLQIAEVGLGAIGRTSGRVAASGAGWAWLDCDGRLVHLTGPSGPMTPVTARASTNPRIDVGARVDLNMREAIVWRSSSPGPRASPGRIEDACRVVAAHRWRDPWADALTPASLVDSLPRLVGRGPGLTPAGDDVLLGFMLMRPDRAASASILAAARHRTTRPSLALLRWAARGEGPLPAIVMRNALLEADASRLATALRDLLSFGGTTGSAILGGLLAGADLRSPPSASPGATPDHHPTSA